MKLALSRELKIDGSNQIIKTRVGRPLPFEELTKFSDKNIRKKITYILW